MAGGCDDVCENQNPFNQGDDDHLKYAWVPKV